MSIQDASKIARPALLMGVLLGLPLAAAAQQKVIQVWPSTPPGSENWTQKEVEYTDPGSKQVRVRNVTTPTLTAFLPDRSTAGGTAVVVCPGGGFRFLSWHTEGTDVADWLAAHGVAAFVLKYRLSETPASEEEFQRPATPAAGRAGNPPMNDVRPLAYADGRQAVKVVRQHAAEWGIAPDRIGILGFSAGGQVTMGVVMEHDPDSRPNFAAPVYGGSLEGKSIPSDAPGLFILAANDDRAGSASSVKLCSDWKAAGLPVELHLFSKGGHGFGMVPHGLPVNHWIDLFGDWLAVQGLMKPAR
ncbi:MAG TPA: alpha/beta hydrolase [Bryobacteraceae bacterium]|nr:alpha/beta hydrolase [Bryobacteraceae bacterium]